MAHPSGFILLAAIRHRCKIGRIGFDQHAIERHAFGNFFEFFSLFESHNAGKGNVETQIERCVGHLLRFGKAVEYAADFVGFFFAQNAQRVFTCGAGMDNQRQAGFTRGADMAAKALALPFQIASQAIVIQTGFTYRHHFFPSGQLDELLNRGFSHAFVIRMYAD